MARDEFINATYHRGMKIKFVMRGYEYTGYIDRVDRRRWASLHVQADDGFHWWIKETDVLEKLSA